MRRPLLAGLAALTLVAGLSAMAPASATPARPAAPAAPTSLDPTKPFVAEGNASLLTVDLPALSPAILPPTNIDLAHSLAAAQNTADLDPDKASAQRTYAAAGTTGDSTLLGAPLDLQTTVASAAPNGSGGDDVLLPLNLSPLLNLSAITTSAAANWTSDTQCVAAATPLSLADQSAVVLDTEQLAPIIALESESTDGAVDSNAATYLASIPGPGDPRAVRATAHTDISGTTLLGGVGEEGDGIQVRVVQTPNYVVSASGKPGGASVTGDDPVVDVDLPGMDTITLDSTNQTEDATLIDISLSDLLDDALLQDALDDLGLGVLDDILTALDMTLGEVLDAINPVVRLSIPIDKGAAADGTNAHVSAAILRVEVLAPDAGGLTEDLADALSTILEALGLDADQPLLDITLGPVSASVRAPAGGIDCSTPTNDNPLRELNKHASAQEVAPGGTFDYDITVPNRGPCTVTNVTVTDEITGPGFEVIATEPEATVAGGKVTFDVGDLAPNETVELTITVKVADDAPDGATFDDLVTATGTCDGEPVSEDEPLLDTPTVRTDFTGPCSVQFSNKEASHDSVEQGETFVYYVHVFNSGAEACEPVDVTDTLIDAVSFVSCNYGCEHDGQKVSWHLDSVAGGSSVVLSVVVQAADDATGTLENTAVITPGNGDPKTVHHNGPVIGPSVPRDPIAPIRVPAAAVPLPHTGGTVPMGVAVGLAGAALGLFALRRRTAT